tara:strand:+ start:5377 stop:6093 length:717 start_codon:yes stop_codon:yes gene_type:complete
MLKTIIRSIVILFCLTPNAAQSHSGGTNANGCHYDRKAGDYHCHEEREEGAYYRQMEGLREHNLNKSLKFLVMLIPFGLLVGPIWYIVYLAVKKEDHKTKRLIKRHKTNLSSESHLRPEPPSVKNDEYIGNIGFTTGVDLMCYACGKDHSLLSYSNCKVCKKPKCRKCASCSDTCKKKQMKKDEMQEQLRQEKLQANRETKEWEKHLQNNPSDCICGGSKRLFNVNVNKYVVCNYCKV